MYKDSAGSSSAGATGHPIEVGSMARVLGECNAKSVVLREHRHIKTYLKAFDILMKITEN